MFTGALMKRRMSWMASPDSRCPPGELTSMSMGADEWASNAIRRRATSLADESEMAPNTRTVRDLKAFSSRNELRGSAVAGADSCSGSFIAGLLAKAQSLHDWGAETAV